MAQWIVLSVGDANYVKLVIPVADRGSTLSHNNLFFPIIPSVFSGISGATVERDGPFYRR